MTPPMDPEEEEAVAALLQLRIPQLTIKVDKPVGRKVQPVAKPTSARVPKTSFNPASASMIKSSRKMMPAQRSINAEAPHCVPSPIPKIPVKKIEKTEEKKCTNCGTTTTSAWRRLDGKLVCNACKLYHRFRKVNRPIEMKADHVITRRKRS